MGKYSHFIDLTGQTFGKLLVLKRQNNFGECPVQWLCKCECGNEKVVISANLRNGTTKSCGCIRKELVGKRFKTHGMTKSRTYKIWSSMKTRCLNPKATNFEYYGGIGVTICEEWLSFDNFLKDMGEAPKEKSIDRINVYEGYSPENCKWSTLEEQAKNKRERKVFSEQALKNFLHSQEYLSKEQKDLLIKNLFNQHQ